jgi:hypothetical protein
MRDVIPEGPLSICADRKTARSLLETGLFSAD